MLSAYFFIVTILTQLLLLLKVKILIKGKKVKFTLEQTMKAQGGSRCIALLLL